MSKTETQSEALRLAQGLIGGGNDFHEWLKPASAELRRLDAGNKALRAQLEQESAIRQHGWSIHYADERDFCLAASPLIGAAYVCGADAVKRLNSSPWGLRHFGVVRATGPTQTDTPQAAAKTGDAA